MLNLALVALLSGTLVNGGGDDRDKVRNPEAPVVETAEPRSIITDTYAFGRASDVAPIKLWVSYAWGEAEGAWNAAGDDVEITIAGTDGDIVSQRIGVGAQLNVLNFPAFKLGVGGQLNVAQNKFQVGEGAGGLITEDLSSDFGLQQVKVYGVARGRVLGAHGGYIIDLGSEQEFAESGLPTNLPNSDGRDAIFFGADFDYPSDRFRLFAGVDYYMLQDDDATEGVEESGDDILMWAAGAGVRFSVFELGAAAQLRTRMKTGGFGSTSPSGSHAGTIAPYLRISPPSLPASIFVKGAVLDEYDEYGYRIGGGNNIKPSIGFTAGITVGFE